MTDQELIADLRKTVANGRAANDNAARRIDELAEELRQERAEHAATKAALANAQSGYVEYNRSTFAHDILAAMASVYVGGIRRADAVDALIVAYGQVLTREQLAKLEELSGRAQDVVDFTTPSRRPAIKITVADAQGPLSEQLKEEILALLNSNSMAGYEFVNEEWVIPDQGKSPPETISPAEPAMVGYHCNGCGSKGRMPALEDDADEPPRCPICDHCPVFTTPDSKQA